MKSMMKVLIAVLVLALLGGGGWFYSAKIMKRRPVELPTITVEEGPIEQTVAATGSVSPLNRVEIKPPISGRMERLLGDEGRKVKAGEVLAWMSSSDRAAILDAARSQGAAAVKHWADAYKPTPIVAPLSGVIILKNVVVGQTVDPTSVLFAMSDHLIVLGQVDEADIGHIRIGMPAWITLDAYPAQRVEGSVSEILYEGKNVSNVITYGVKVTPGKTPPFFRSEMTANISFIVTQREKTLLLPVTAVQDLPDGGKQVSVPGPDGKAVPRPVKTGLENNDKIEIVSGLAAGEKVVLASGKYIPQQGPKASPLTSGRR